MERPDLDASEVVPPTRPWGVPLGQLVATAPATIPTPAPIPPNRPPPVTGGWPLPGVGIGRAPLHPPSRPARPPQPRTGGGRDQPGRRSLAMAAMLAAAAVGGAAATGTGSLGGLLDRGSAGAGNAATSRAVAVTAFVQQLDTALRAGDRRALMAAVDPADAVLRERWSGLPTRATRVGARAVHLRPGAITAGEPRAGFGETVRVQTTLNYTLTPWDRSPVSSVLVLHLGRQGQTWRLIEDPRTPSGEVGGPLEPWLAGPVGVAQRAHVLVVGDATRKGDNERLAGALERAVVSVRQVVPSRRWNGRVVAYASTSDRFVASWFGTRAAGEGRHGGTDPASFAAEVRTLAGQAGSSGRAGSSSRGGAAGAAPSRTVAVAARMAVTPFLLERSDARAQAVLRHEVAHVALALEGPGSIPTWLVEGTAEYAAYREVSAGRVSGVAAMDRRGLPASTWTGLRKGTWRPRLALDAQTFYGGTNADVARSYTDAWLVCLYIAARYGEQGLFDLYAAAAVRPPGEPAATGQAAVLREVLRIDSATLSREAVVYARGLRRSFT